MRKFLRRLLGLDASFAAIEEDIDHVLQKIMRQWADTNHKFAELDLTLTALRSDLATTFATDEFDAKRKATSDELGQKVLKRLEAEDWARRHSEGKC